MKYNSYLIFLAIITSNKAQDHCSSNEFIQFMNPTCVRDLARNLSTPHQRNVSLRNTLQKIDRYLDAPKSIFRSAQISYNSTDEILDNLDQIIIKESAYRKYELISTKNLLVQIFNIRTSSISGIVLYDDSPIPRFEPLYRNSTLAAVLKNGNFWAAAYLPKRLLEQIAKSVKDPIVAITVFYHDSLFSQNEIKKTNDIIFGVLIPGFKEEFKTPIKLAYKVNDFTQRECAHWAFGENIKGSWRTDQASLTCGIIEVCDYYHVTHFGMLVLDDVNSLKHHKKALEIITLVNSCLSMFGIFGIFLTALFFKKWRDNKGNIILANYSIATILEIIILYVSDYIKEKEVCDETWCFWSGVLLHYIVLAQFCWVLVISYLQYKRYVQIIGAPTTRLILKSCLIGWCLPLLIVLFPAIFASDNYVRSNANLCYPSGLSLYLAVFAPLLVIIITNCIVFVFIIRTIFGSKIDVPRLSDNVTILKFRLIVFLFFQLGLSWIFGLLSHFGIAFVYLFCILAPLQGFTVFLLFIVFNETTTLYYKKLFGLQQKKKLNVASGDASSSTRVS